MAAEKLNATLQENLITILAWNDKHGRIVSQLVNPALFEGEYRNVAERCVDYWRKFNEAPKVHTPDLFSDILDDPANRRGRILRRILNSMFQLSEEVNTGYVLDQLKRFTRMQRLKDGILRSAEKLNQNQEMAIDEVEDLWNDLLRSRGIDFEPGLRLNEYEKVLEFFESREHEFSTGIEELDKRHIGPARGAVGLFLAATGRGKSWWLMHLGRRSAFVERKKVLHISLEMPAEQVATRYYQSLFAISKRDPRAEVTGLIKDSKGFVEDFDQSEVIADFTLSSDHIKDELEVRVGLMGTRMNNLLIKRFPTRSLSVKDLRAFLDNLELVEKFIPDHIILDYIGIMATDANNHRISLGRICEDLRGLAIERNAAIDTAQQMSKRGAMALVGNLGHVSEDWSLTNTADVGYIFSQTDAEERFGLARLFMGKVRDEEKKGLALLLSQNYRHGQFVLDTALLGDGYFDSFKDFSGEDLQADRYGDDEESEHYDD